MSHVAEGKMRPEAQRQEQRHPERRLLELRHLEDRWDFSAAAAMDEPELLRYRSNLLGSDLRITNFGGGNTSSKVRAADPLSGEEVSVLWVKGSGGDLGSIRRSGFATLYLQKLLALEKLYGGVEREDEMVTYYPLLTFGTNPVVASIDTPLHGFLPPAHVDHLHPDCAIAMAAAANGHTKMEEFNRRFGHALVWLPWQRPGFELAMMMKQSVEQTPGCDGIVLGGHGLFTWGETQRDCYANTLTVIDQLTTFIEDHRVRKGARIFGGEQVQSLNQRRELAAEILPFLRGQASQQRRVIASYSDQPEVLRFVNSAFGRQLAYMGTSCPDHFIRTKIRPMFVPWDPATGMNALKTAIAEQLTVYRREYAEYYSRHAGHDSPAMRDANPTVVLIPGLGMVSLGKSKTEARIAGEFYVNAIHVMEGAAALEGEEPSQGVPQCGAGALAQSFQAYSNYVSLPPSEAYRIEYWALEDAKLRRLPAEKELSRHIVLVLGGGSAAGREIALLAAARGAHVVVADQDSAKAMRVTEELRAMAGKEFAAPLTLDLRSSGAIRESLRDTIVLYGGVDVVIRSQPSPPSPLASNAGEPFGAALQQAPAIEDRLLVEEVSRRMREQELTGSVVLIFATPPTSPGATGNEADAGGVPLGKLVDELATAHAPSVRVNGLSLASTRQPSPPGDHGLPEDEPHPLLADCSPEDSGELRAAEARACAEAVLFLAGPGAVLTTGHLFPVASRRS